MNQKARKNLFRFILPVFAMLVALSFFQTKAFAMGGQKWTLTINPGEGSGSSISASLGNGQLYTLPSASFFTAPEGKTLLGFSLTPQASYVQGSSALYTPGSPYSMKPYSHTLYAIYGYTVTFDSDGGTAIPSQSVVSGGYAQAPSNPYREGSNGESFIGWYEYTSYVNDYTSIPDSKFDFANTPITESITLHAVYGKGGYARVLDNTPGNQSADRGATLQFGHTESRRVISSSGKITTRLATIYEDLPTTNWLHAYSKKMRYPIYLKAVVAEGYHFVEWRKGSSSGEAVSSDPILKFDSYEAYDGAAWAWWAVVEKDSETQKSLPAYRLYNPNSHEHFYTLGEDEKDTLVGYGWQYEGVAWKSPELSSIPVYRLYNPNAGDHHYTTSEEERDNVVAAGWNYEGIAWYSDEAKSVPVYRLYNPNEQQAGAHHYTTSEEERNNLLAAGWRDEGIGWYGVN